MKTKEEEEEEETSSVGNLVLENKQGGIVLCVIDFSEPSTEALQAAIKIARATASTLTVLYPYRLNQPRNIPDLSQWKRNIESDATSNFHRMTSTLLRDSHVSCEFKVEVGFIDDRVEVFAKTHDVTLVVVSSELIHKSDGAFTDMLEKLKSPLLIVPTKEPMTHEKYTSSN